MARICIVATLLLAGCANAPPPRNDGSPCAAYGEASQQCQVYRYMNAGM